MGVLTDLKKGTYRALCRAGVDHWSRRRRTDQLLIVGYHGVVSADRTGPGSWLMLPDDQFEKQIEYLSQCYSIISMTQAAHHLARSEPFEKPTACITFDDGYRNNLTVALPILQKYRAPATIYLVTGFVGTNRVHWTARLERALHATRVDRIDLTNVGLRRYPLGDQTNVSYVRMVSRLYRMKPHIREAALEQAFRLIGSVDGQDFSDFAMMTWDEARQLSETGLIEFGGHTVNHQIVEPLNDAELQDEIGQSVLHIEQELSARSSTFAYPNGTPTDFDERAERVLLDRGIIAAVSTIEGLNDASARPFALRRITIGSDMSIEEFRLRVSGVVTDLKGWLGNGKHDE